MYKVICRTQQYATFSKFEAVLKIHELNEAS